jgi:hypothetical protein
MGPPLCTRGKRTGYVDLRHVFFGDHTVGESALLFSSLLGLCCDLLPPSSHLRGHGSIQHGSHVFRLVEACSTSLHRHMADPVKFASISLLLFRFKHGYFCLVPPLVFVRHRWFFFSPDLTKFLDRRITSCEPGNAV